MKANYLVCYDIRDEKRLMRVFKCVRKVGLHVQYSVFHCRLTWPELLELKAVLGHLIDAGADDIRVYPLPKDFSIAVMGRGTRVPDGVNFFLS
jgi:CRISPR-associated protein Cas2